MPSLRRILRLSRLARFPIGCRDASRLSVRAPLGCALRTRKLVHGMHPTEGNGGLYGSVNCSSLFLAWGFKLTDVVFEFGDMRIRHSQAT